MGDKTIGHVPVPDELRGTGDLLEIRPKDLREGDEIFACRNQSWSHWSVWPAGGIRVASPPVESPGHGRTNHTYQHVTVNDSSGRLVTDTRYSDQFVLVRRAGASSSKVSVFSAWNGRCPRCGKGTYQGFMSLEHEGGGCDDGKKS